MAFLRIVVAILVQTTLSRVLQQSLSPQELSPGTPWLARPYPYITGHTGNDIRQSVYTSKQVSDHDVAGAGLPHSFLRMRFQCPHGRDKDLPIRSSLSIRRAKSTLAQKTRYLHLETWPISLLRGHITIFISPLRKRPSPMQRLTYGLESKKSGLNWILTGFSEIGRRKPGREPSFRSCPRQ